MEQNMDLLAAAASAYSSAAYLRKRRHRFKQFTYGAQWGDSVRDHDGRWVTEGEMAARNGRVPMTNNMIRRLVKNIVGRFQVGSPRDAEGCPMISRRPTVLMSSTAVCSRSF